jgi:hypothetical protein
MSFWKNEGGNEGEMKNYVVCVLGNKEKKSYGRPKIVLTLVQYEGRCDFDMIRRISLTIASRESSMKEKI